MQAVFDSADEQTLMGPMGGVEEERSLTQVVNKQRLYAFAVVSDGSESLMSSACEETGNQKMPTGSMQSQLVQTLCCTSTKRNPDGLYFEKFERSNSRTHLN